MFCDHGLCMCERGRERRHLFKFKAFAPPSGCSSTARSVGSTSPLSIKVPAASTMAMNPLWRTITVPSICVSCATNSLIINHLSFLLNFGVVIYFKTQDSELNLQKLNIFPEENTRKNLQSRQRDFTCMVVLSSAVIPFSRFFSASPLSLRL